MEWIIKKSQVPEDPIHSKNTLEWLLKLKPDADDALKIAALGHDIERAIAERKVRREDFKRCRQHLVFPCKSAILHSPKWY